MTDTVSQVDRSRVMRAVHSTNTRSTERRFRAILAAKRIGHWKSGPNDLPGSPDLVFPKERLAVFLDGCFWHGCVKCYRRPNSRREYWDAKLASNVARDIRSTNDLLAIGWQVLRFWEHEIQDSPMRCVSTIVQELGNRESLASQKL